MVSAWAQSSFGTLGLAPLTMVEISPRDPSRGRTRRRVRVCARRPPSCVTAGPGQSDASHTTPSEAARFLTPPWPRGESYSGSPLLAVNHCFRTYVWGMILAGTIASAPSPELLYVARMLHDPALTDRFRDYAPMPAFAARGRILADAWARERGLAGAQMRHLGDVHQPAPQCHGTARARARARTAAGRRRARLIGLRPGASPATVAAVVERYPRMASKARRHGSSSIPSHTTIPSAAAQPLADVRARSCRHSQVRRVTSPLAVSSQSRCLPHLPSANY